MTGRESLCDARVAGAQGGFCRNEAQPGSRYCEVHDNGKPSVRAVVEGPWRESHDIIGHVVANVRVKERTVVVVLAAPQARDVQLAEAAGFVNAVRSHPRPQPGMIEAARIIEALIALERDQEPGC